MRHRSPRKQHGVAALAVVALLLIGALLAAMLTGRSLLAEQRGAANQMRSTQAFEAAEAGVEWALAQLNANRRIGTDCQPSSDPVAPSFRARYLAIDAATGAITPATAHADCVRDAGAWSCHCPASGAASVAAGSGAGPAFDVQFATVAQSGLVRIAATGCARPGSACGGAPAGADPSDGSARLDVIVGLVGGLRTPAATVTVRGDFDAGGAPIALVNADPARGIAVDAGGALHAAQALLTPPAGAPSAGMLVGADAALAALAPGRLFAATFGTDAATWRRQAAAIRLGCNGIVGDCGTAVAAAAAAAPEAALIHVDGDLTLHGPLALGSADRPVTLVVGGALQFDGAVALHGLVHAASLAWTHTGGGAYLRGALLSDGGYQGDGAPTLVYDTALLGRLARTSGSFVRVAGGWRDF